MTLSFLHQTTCVRLPVQKRLVTLNLAPYRSRSSRAWTTSLRIVSPRWSSGVRHSIAVLPCRTRAQLLRSPDSSESSRHEQRVASAGSMQTSRASSRLAVHPVLSAAQRQSFTADYDGYIYKQESGNTFDGTNIQAIYRSPDYTMGDAGIRKLMQRIIWNYDNDGTVNSKFRIRYDFNSADVPQPAEYDLTTGAAIAIYGLASIDLRHCCVRIIGHSAGSTERRGWRIYSSSALGRHTRISPHLSKRLSTRIYAGGRR